MINVQIQSVLRALQSREAPPHAVLPPPRVAAIAAIAPVASEGIEADSARSAASDTGRRFAGGDPASWTKASQAPASTTRAAVRGTAPGPATIVALGPAPEGTNPSIAGRPASTSLQLSGVAQLIDELRQGARPDAESSAAIRPAQSLVVAPSVEADALAVALRQSIGRSGLFYESHLADWVLRQYPQADLQQEPQAAWPAPAANAPASSPATGEAALPAPFIALPDIAAPLVRDQLETLETRQLLWNGAVWPGQQATIAINEDESARATADAPTWRTRLTVDLPQLGRIVADLALRGTALQVTLRVAEPVRSSLSAAAHDTLSKALGARSFDARIVTVAHGHAG